MAEILRRMWVRVHEWNQATDVFLTSKYAINTNTLSRSWEADAGITAAGADAIVGCFGDAYFITGISMDCIVSIGASVNLMLGLDMATLMLSLVNDGEEDNQLNNEFLGNTSWVSICLRRLIIGLVSLRIW